MKVEGFTSQRNAHVHLLKHVLRLAGHPRERLRDETDPENWSEIVRDPPLPASVHQRRSIAVGTLKAISGCEAGRRAPTTGEPCRECEDPGAQVAASAGLGALLGEYLAVAREALAWALRTHDRRGVRLVAYRTEDGSFVETVDERHVKIIGRLDEPSSSVRLITCYRSLGTPLSLQWLELARLRAAFARSGRLVPVP